MDGLVRAALGAGRQDSSNIVLDEFAIYITSREPATWRWGCDIVPFRMIASRRRSGLLFLRPASGIILFPTGPDSPFFPEELEHERPESLSEILLAEAR